MTWMQRGGLSLVTPHRRSVDQVWYGCSQRPASRLVRAAGSQPPCQSQRSGLVGTTVRVHRKYELHSHGCQPAFRLGRNDRTDDAVRRTLMSSCQSQRSGFMGTTPDAPFWSLCKMTRPATIMTNTKTPTCCVCDKGHRREDRGARIVRTLPPPQLLRRDHRTPDGQAHGRGRHRGPH